MMSKICFTKLTLFALLCFFTTISFAHSATQISKISISKEKQVEVVTDNKTAFKAFILDNPHRLVIDVENAQVKDEAKKIIDNLGIVQGARFGNYKSEDKQYLRIVFDLKNKITVSNFSFVQGQGNAGKIIIKINDNAQTATQNNDLASLIDKTIITKRTPPKPAAPTINTTPKNTQQTKKPTIVIDAGHGGKDPGAIGRFARTKEKDIALSYALELAKELQKSGKYRVYMTRTGDHFIPLKNRVGKARKVNADLFISLHANSSENKNTSGFSIYTLSEKSSDKQAELLAAKENRADIIAGIDFAGASPDVMSTLINLSQRSSMNSSSNYANVVINMMKRNKIEVLQNTHRFAGFMVLTAPDVTSVLIEIGYLTNKAEERKMNSYNYRKKITKILADSVDQYFNAY